jgi:hypothetical protein
MRGALQVPVASAGGAPADSLRRGGRDVKARPISNSPGGFTPPGGTGRQGPSHIKPEGGDRVKPCARETGHELTRTRTQCPLGKNL